MKSTMEVELAVLDIARAEAEWLHELLNRFSSS